MWLIVCFLLRQHFGHTWRAYSSLQWTHKSQLTSSLLIKTTGGNFTNETHNKGEKDRRAYFTRPPHVHLSRKLFCDLFQQNRPLITGVPILWADPNFHFVSTMAISPKSSKRSFATWGSVHDGTFPHQTSWSPYQSSCWSKQWIVIWSA